MGGRTIRIKGGQCGPNVPGYFSVRAGVFTFSPQKPRFRFFALYTDAARDGTYRNQRAAFEYPGHHYEIYPNTVTLRGGRSRGVFSGSIATGQRVTGSFRCYDY